MLNYRDWLYSELVRIAKNNDLGNYTFYVFDEQDFTKSKQVFDKKSIFVIIKHLSTSIMYNAEVEPLQIYIMSEENSLEVANIIFKLFVNKNNWIITQTEKDITKHQYSEPVVLNNFQAVGIGYRSVLFASATLYTIKNAIDLKGLKIDGEDITPIDFSMSYTLATDSQLFPNKNFAKSVRTGQTMAFTLTIPAKECEFLKNVFKILRDESSGNRPFELMLFFKNEEHMTVEVKLSGFTMMSAPSEIPSIKIGLVL